MGVMGLSLMGLIHTPTKLTSSLETQKDLKAQYTRAFRNRVEHKTKPICPYAGA
jgi:hypothetical protein